MAKVEYDGVVIPFRPESTHVEERRHRVHPQSYSTVQGRLDRVSLNGDRLTFYLATPYGYSVRCEFDESMLKTVIDARRKEVRVDGIYTFDLEKGQETKGIAEEIHIFPKRDFNEVLNLEGSSNLPEDWIELIEEAKEELEYD